MKKLRTMLAAALVTGTIVLAAPTPAPATGDVCVTIEINGGGPTAICIPIP